MNRILSPDFKTTSCPVIIDFLIRHGIINPENGELNIYIKLSNNFNNIESYYFLLIKN